MAICLLLYIARVFNLSLNCFFLKLLVNGKNIFVSEVSLEMFYFNFCQPYLFPIKTDIDDCASHPCKNNGTCTDRVNGFNCSCAPGFNGTQCESGNC